MTDLVKPRDRSVHKRAMAALRRRQRRRPPATPPDEWGYRDNAARAIALDRTGRPVVAVDSDPVITAIAAAEPPELAAVEARAGDELPATSADDWARTGPRGEHHPRSMLDYATAEEIRAEWARGGITQGELAARHFISLATCKRVLSGQSYSAPPAEPPPVESAPTPKRPPRKPRDRARVCRDWDYRDVDANRRLEPAVEVLSDPAPTIVIPAPAAVEVTEPTLSPPSPSMADEWPSGRRPILDHQAHALVVELRAAGWSWRAIGRRLGVSDQVARHAAARLVRIETAEMTTSSHEDASE